MKEAVDKPRIFHQLVPMQIQYEYGMTKVILEYNSLTKYYLTTNNNNNIICLVLSFRM